MANVELHSSYTYHQPITNVCVDPTGAHILLAMYAPRFVHRFASLPIAGAAESSRSGHAVLGMSRVVGRRGSVNVVKADAPRQIVQTLSPETAQLRVSPQSALR
jgi:hypothetical protein